MAAYIQSSVNPVLISAWSLIQKKTVQISWSTDSPFLGYVYLSIDGGPEKIFDGSPSGKVSNSTPPPSIDIEFGKTYDFRLKRNSMLNPVLATLRLKGEEKLGTTAGLAKVIKEMVPRSQHIFGLHVYPGIDSVRIKFRTRQATGAAVEITNDVTQKVVAFALSAGTNQVHDVKIAKGVNLTPESLKMGTPHSFKIVAPQLPGSLTTKESVLPGKFRTGGRNATVFFNRIIVHNDGDPGARLADGDFTFWFGAGDVDDIVALGEDNYGEEAIGSGEFRDVNKEVFIGDSPVGMWVQALAFENDIGYEFGFSGPGTRGPGLPLDPGVTCEDWNDGDGVFATVTQHFDFSHLADEVEDRLFEMTNHSCAIHFTVACRLRVEAFLGSLVEPFIKKSGPPPRSPLPRVAMIRNPGDRVFVGTGSDRALSLRLAPGGALFARTPSNKPSASKGRRTRIAGEFAGPVTVVASSEDQFRLFTLDRDGGVSHKAFSRDVPQNEEWESLGGEFVGSIAAAVGPDGRIEIFGLSRDGVVSHRTLSAESAGPAVSDWQRIGDGIGGSLTAFTTPRGVSVVARDRDGEVLHKLRRGNEWRPAGREWQSLGAAPAGPLFAELVEDDVVVLAVLAEDESIMLRPWRNYPDAPRDDWRSVGTINSLLESRLSLIEPSPEKDTLAASSATNGKT
jgi:hypothetical protein